MLETALLCLSLNVYFEARGEPILGQYAVAQVTMNRAGHDPRKVCREVFKPYQFSWTAERAERVGHGYRLKPGHHPVETLAWDNAVKIAQVVLSGKIAIDFSGGAKFFHADGVVPHWKRSMKRTTKIGGHTFYSNA